MFFTKQVRGVLATCFGKHEQVIPTVTRDPFSPEGDSADRFRQTAIVCRRVSSPVKLALFLNPS